MRTRSIAGLSACLLAGLLGVLGTTADAAAPNGPSPGLVVSEVYGAGGNSGSNYPADYVELFNRGAATVPLDGKSLQYTSATGTGNFGGFSGSTTVLSGSIEPGQYILVQASTGSPPVAGDITLQAAMAAAGGKVALAVGTEPLGCNSAVSCAANGADARLVDLVGYGNANYFEGAGPAQGATLTTATRRAGEGCVDTDDNSFDFASGSQDPDNAVSTRNLTCGGPTVVATAPSGGATEVPTDSNVTVEFSEAVTAADDAFSMSCGSTGTVDLTVTSAPEPTTSFVLDPDEELAKGDTCTVSVEADAVEDAAGDHPPGDYAFSFTTTAIAGLRIHDIQGGQHLSPYGDLVVAGLPGVVTALRGNGFWMQDPSPDADDATSEGLFVFTSTAPSVVRGDAVTVSGLVSEFRPGGSGTGNLTTTEIVNAAVHPAGPGAAVAPTVVGVGGRVPPGATIEDDAAGDVETGGVFDPAQDGIDFYESLEGMLVQVNDAAVVGPTSGFGETWVLGDGGTAAAPRTNRGGIVITPADFNPERIQIDDVLTALPVLNVGDRIPGATVGVLSYDFGNFELLPLQAPVAVAGGLAREVTLPPQADELSVATYNVENLDPGDTSFARHADLIVNHLRSPDLIAVEEIQDNNGPTNDGQTDATATFDTLVKAIADAGGPAYSWRQINPLDDQDGGEPGGNIRVGFLFRTDRGLGFVDRPGGDSTTPTGVFRSRGDAHLTLSPGRVDPANPAWEATRKPLAGEFTWRGKTLIVVANHFSSKGGDDALFGRRQPPVRSSEPKRHQQAASVNAFVRGVVALDRRALVVVLGDINDFEFSGDKLEILEGGGVLKSLLPLLPKAERYSYVFEGNSQVLDQVLGSPAVLASLRGFDVVHVNAEFADQASDHDPSVARLGFD